VFVIGAIGLLLWRKGYARTALLLGLAVLIAGTLTLINTRGTETQSYSIGASGIAAAEGSANIVLNGRVDAWKAALGPEPGDWVLGRGVGQVGTAAERATYSISRPSETELSYSTAVDSGYLATVADVGVVGLAVLLALYGRLVALGIASARRDEDAGWVALALLGALLIAALTGSAFTGFPTAFLALLLVGVALAAGREEAEPSTAQATGRDR
jgi:O-antigen ligase